MYFGTSGIRGIVGKKINIELCSKLPMAIGKQKLIVLRDGRYTGSLFLNIFKASCAFQGIDVIDFGIGPTPFAVFLSKELKTTCVMITASHNDERHNGFKIFENGEELSENRRLEIEEKLKEEIKYVDIQDMKTSEKINELEKREMIEKYFDVIEEIVGSKGEMLHGLGKKVLIDPVNSSAVWFAKQLFTRFGFKVKTINSNFKKHFNRNPEPKKQNLAREEAILQNYDFDFGVFFDGDADRAIIGTHEFGVLGLDEQMMLTVNKIKNVRNIVSTVELSLGMETWLSKKNIGYDITPVGSRQIAMKIKTDKYEFGGEPCGEYIFSKKHLIPDGLLTSLFLCLNYNEGEIEKKINEFPRFKIIRKNYVCKDKQKSMENIKKNIGYKFNEIDGILIEEDGFRVLIRPSGTEDKIRLKFETKQEEAYKLEKIIKENLV